MVALYLDLETYSDVDLPSAGVHRYAEHPSAEVLLLGWAVNGGPVSVVDLRAGQPVPERLRELLEAPDTVCWAHNAEFERTMLWHCLGIQCPPERWRCTMAWAAYLSLPQGLAALATELRIDQGKMKLGKDLIRRYCLPAGRALCPEPALDPGWPTFIEYCRRDVVVQRSIVARLDEYEMPESEWRVWALDQTINDRGLPVDRAMVSAAEQTWASYQEARAEDARDITGLANAASRTQLLRWCHTRGVELPDLRAETVAQTITDPTLPQDAREVLSIRHEIALSSPAKFSKILSMVSADDRLRGQFAYHKAHTGRWAGRGVQPHNFPRGSLSPAQVEAARQVLLTSGRPVQELREIGPVADVLSSLVRSSIAAPPGVTLVCADYVSIESVVLGWVAGSEPLLRVFREGLDPYKTFATALFDIPYDDVTKTQRTLAKPAVLGCGYGLGARGLQRYSATFGVQLDDDEAARQVGVFRATYREIGTLWRDLNDACIDATRTGPGAQVRVRGFEVTVDRRYLLLGLPSGRELHYYRPAVSDVETPWGERRPTFCALSGTQRVTYHGGKLVENVVQALARDVLVHGLLQVESAGLPWATVGHVHDEIITLVPATEDPAAALKALQQCMGPPTWAPDMPVRAEGWTGQIYRKE